MDIVKRQEIYKAYKGWAPAELTSLTKDTPDPLPFVMRSEEVPFLKAAVAQWGRLLPLVYHDLWGEQTLVKEGVLDADLVWGQLGLDPAFFNGLPAFVEPLSLLRFDLVRHTQGWRLVRLGTDVPRGLGLALETRIAHGRSFGAKVPHANLLRLAPFFQGLKDLWFHDSLTHKDEPSIMVWTSGPSDPLYAEPVALSRYFGYPLVESRDLTVRSGKVFLKTLGGLKPVDVLVRMVSDRSLDPLAGNPGGSGGVAGLMQAVRDGAVLVTNAPGAGWLGHPALLPHYDALCQRFLGEPLQLRPDQGRPGAEEFFEEGQWTSRSVGLRLFAARFPQGWELMPGGLVQKLEADTFHPDDFSGTKKDLWFLSSEAEPLVSLLPSGEPAEINRASDLPSRVADDLFWLGRYTERAWVDLRFLEKHWELKYGGGPENRSVGAEFIDKLVKDLEILHEAAEQPEAAWKDSRLADTVGSVHRIAGQVLDRLSLETHRILGEFGLFLSSGHDAPLPEVLRQLNLRLAAFSGLTMESMTRSTGWRFLDMGRRLERARLLVESLQGFFALTKGDENLTILLDIFDSTLTYRTRYRLAPQRGPVLDLLLLDETNPRSLAFQLESLAHHVEHLPRGNQRPYWAAEERAILDLLTRVRLTDGINLVPGVLEPLLEALLERLEEFSNALHQTYLAKIDPMESLQARSKGSE